MGARKDCRCARVKHEHGTARAYESDGCRCTRCAVAYSRRKAAWIAGSDERFTTPHVCGVRRRLQALTMLGWSPTELARHTGLNHQVILRLRNPGRTEHVLWSTYEVVCSVYEDLWNQRSIGPHHRRMANLARRKGWATPMAWDDDEIDNPAALPAAAPTTESARVDEVLTEQLVDGVIRLPSYSRAPEISEAVRILAGRGFSDTQIGERIGRQRDAVLKIRERAGIPNGVERRAA